MEVKLTYFKDTGKYYSEGEYESVYGIDCFLGDVWNEVRRRRSIYKLPNISDGSYFIILVEVPDHPNNHPKLILPL